MTLKIVRGPVAGVPLDEQFEPPEWIADGLTEPQRTRTIARTQWITVVLHPDMPLSSAATAVAMRLLLFTSGKDLTSPGQHGPHSAWPAIDTLAGQLKMSRNTVKRAIRDLERDGWVVVDRGHRPRLYRLSWPTEPVLMERHDDQAPTCGSTETKNGAPCTRRAGWGSIEADGPCVKHGGTPKASLVDPQRSTNDPHERSTNDGNGSAVADEWSTADHECISSPSGSRHLSTPPTSPADADPVALFAAELRDAGIDDDTIRHEVNRHRANQGAAQ